MAPAYDEHAAVEQKIEKDQRKRDAWLQQNSKANESILVGDDITLDDLHRWLKEALTKV